MREIPLTQGKVALVDDNDYEYLNQWKWHATKAKHTWYAERNIGENKRRTIRMHQALMPDKIEICVDHKNSDGLDNRRCNLRYASYCQNSQNKRSFLSSAKTSKYKGVCWDKEASKWSVEIWVNKKKIYLGRFIDEELAGEVYRAAARFFFEGFANDVVVS